MIIAMLGAESTGKTQLAQALADRLPALTGWRCTAVPELLRAWCDREGRTPRPDEQAGIAEAQARHILDAAATHDLVIADTTPLMTAVYSDLLFDDRSLWPPALDFHRRHVDAVLLTALDLPWVADGLQRDGPQVRAPVDARVRQGLAQAGQAYAVVHGQGEARLDSALDALSPLLGSRLPPHGGGSGLFSRLQRREAAQPAWRWTCDNCDVPDCEHALRRQRDAG